MVIQTASKQRRGEDWGNQKSGQKTEKKMYISYCCHHTSTHDAMIRATHKKFRRKKGIFLKKRTIGGIWGHFGGIPKKCLQGDADGFLFLRDFRVSVCVCVCVLCEYVWVSSSLVVSGYLCMCVCNYFVYSGAMWCICFDVLCNS